VPNFDTEVALLEVAALCTQTDLRESTMPPNKFRRINMGQSFMATSSGGRSTITLMVETGSFTETVVGDSEIYEFTC